MGKALHVELTESEASILALILAKLAAAASAPRAVAPAKARYTDDSGP